jgi:ABC-type uncharacterized transport system auxiliary subunit
VRAALVLVAALLGACVSPAQRDADRYFVLDASPPGVEAHGSPRPGVHVAATTATSFYDSQSIVYSRMPGTRAYYQFNHWTERPHRVIHAHLAERLGEDGRGSALVLSTHLEEIYHDAVQPPGTARITITAQLADRAGDGVIARRTFSRVAPAVSYDATGAVQGLRQALFALLDDLAAWVASEVSARASEG